MTLKEYYEALDKLEAPEGLSFPERRAYFLLEKEKLQEQLSDEDLNTVLSRQRDWQRKMQSSVG